MAKLFDDQLSRIGINRLVHRRHHAHFHKRFDNISRTFGHTIGQFLNDNCFRQLNIAHHFFARGVHAHRFLAGPFLFALHRGHRPLAPTFACNGFGQGQLIGAARIVATLGLGARIAITATLIAFTVDLAGCRWRCRAGLATLGGRLGRCSGGCRCRSGPGARVAACGVLRGRCLFAGGQFRFAFRTFLGFNQRALFGLKLALFALFGFEIIAATLTLDLALAFIFGALRRIIGFASTRSLHGFQPAIHFRISNAGRPARWVALNRGACAACSTWLGHHHAFALGFHQNAFGAAMTKALLYLTGR